MAIADSYFSLSQLREAINEAGLESSNIILGVDFTSSNTSAGKHSFPNSPNLHSISNHGLNPYERALSSILRTLEPYDYDGLIPLYGFGDGAQASNSAGNTEIPSHTHSTFA